MSRLGRVVFPGLPYHVTQRGNGRARTFFGDDEYALYRDLLAETCAAARVEVWACVLTPNHVHLILAPHDEDDLRRAMAPTHRRYAGHFWQGRFGCVVMDDDHLAAALVYVALNPVRAQDWRWSSVHAHLSLVANDGLTASWNSNLRRGLGDAQGPAVAAWETRTETGDRWVRTDECTVTGNTPEIRRCLRRQT